ncbi:MAG TPA: hypothetical protein VGQ06_07005 [Gemmatimonadales bacterium]|jgi:hypothetical protein|nr:hypothetical protein [Gemmatimonadales bacterium]
MFRMILFTQWKWSRLVIALSAVAAFALPVLSVERFGRADVSRWEVQEMLTSIQAWGVLYPVLAAALALLVAALAWSPDHRSRHVYALSLPVPRWHYVLLRLGAGAILLAGPVLALWAGALVATTAATIPPGLHAYPTTLALRFALAVLVAYGVIFAVSSGTARTAGYVLGALGALIAFEVLAAAAEVNVHILGPVLLRLFVWPGPLEVFTGRWMLIDV